MRLRLINIGHLLTGDFLGTLIGLLVFIISGRALGTENFGILALTISYGRAVQRLVAFQSWQPLIKYGAELSKPEHIEDYKSLMKFGFLVDVAAAAVAYLVAIGGALIFGPLIGVSEAALHLVLIYSTILLFNINGFPTAVMRLAGRFRIMAYSSLLNLMLRLVLCVFGLIFEQGILYFIIIFAMTQILGSLFLFVLAMFELRRKGASGLLWAPIRGVSKRFTGLWAFTIGSNVELTLRATANELDTLFVGALAGPSAAGLYHIAKRFGRLMLQFGVRVQAVLYPDVARLWADRAIDEFRKTVMQMELLLAGLGGLIFIGISLTIHPIIHWTLGDEFIDAAPLVTVQMIAVAMVLSGSVARSALLAMGRQLVVLKIVVIATLAFHATAIVAIYYIGAMGANIAHAVMATILLVGLLTAYTSALKASSSTMPNVEGMKPDISMKAD
ncbi:oligosaccharide flippase family protein [Stappia sp. GBMRC 2046]|uniref:Oligosaccharide flippase family protein n=1 Tax=Stappia sediminis TaxID=2692190 RepID=A0A7X3LYM5_9HYPH|nr:oligosaccharide flippase family protein [Stappia sediminis]